MTRKKRNMTMVQSTSSKLTKAWSAKRQISALQRFKLMSKLSKSNQKRSLKKRQDLRYPTTTNEIFSQQFTQLY